MTNQEIVNIFNEIIKKSNFFATSEEVNQWLAINELYVLYGNYEEIMFGKSKIKIAPDPLEDIVRLRYCFALKVEFQIISFTFYANQIL